MKIPRVTRSPRRTLVVRQLREVAFHRSAYTLVVHFARSRGERVTARRLREIAGLENEEDDRAEGGEGSAIIFLGSTFLVRVRSRFSLSSFSETREEPP